MVEVVNLDSDEEDDYATHYRLFLEQVRMSAPSHPMFSELISKLDEVKRRCPESYLTSSQFREAMDRCRTGMYQGNVVRKLHVFGQELAANCEQQPPHKRRRLAPPLGSTGTTARASTSAASAFQPAKLSSKTISHVMNLVKSKNPTTAHRPTILPTPAPQQISQPVQQIDSSFSSPLHQAPSNEDNFNSIVENLKSIHSEYKAEPDVSKVMPVFINHLTSPTLSQKRVSISSMARYCSMLTQVQSPLSLLFHLRKLLMMKYFLEIDPVEIRPNEWFLAPYQVVPYHLAEYVLFAVFRRLLEKVLPPTKAKMINLFHQKFRSALLDKKREVLDRIAQLELTDSEKTLSSRGYAATILCCLGDCMEILIRGPGAVKPAPKSCPVVIDLEPVKTSESSSRKRRSSSHSGSGPSSSVSSPLIDQDIIAFPTNIDPSESGCESNDIPDTDADPPDADTGIPDADLPHAGTDIPDADLPYAGTDIPHAYEGREEGEALNSEGTESSDRAKDTATPEIIEKETSSIEKETPVEKATNPTEIETISTEKETIPVEQQPSSGIEKTPIENEPNPSEKETSSTEKESTSVEQQPSYTEKETTPIEKDSSSTGKETNPVEDETASSEKQISFIEKEMGSIEKETIQVERESTSSEKETSSTVKETSNFMDKETTVVEQEQISFENATTPVEKESSSTEKETSPVEKEPNSSDRSPSEKETASVEEETNPSGMEIRLNETAASSTKSVEEEPEEEPVSSKDVRAVSEESQKDGSASWTEDQTYPPPSNSFDGQILSIDESKDSGKEISGSCDQKELTKEVKTGQNVDSIEIHDNIELPTRTKWQRTTTSDSIEIIEPTSRKIFNTLDTKKSEAVDCDDLESEEPMNLEKDLSLRILEDPQDINMTSREDKTTLPDNKDSSTDIPLSQKSVEFVEENSLDLMITSVKTGRTRYVEVTLESCQDSSKTPPVSNFPVNPARTIPVKTAEQREQAVSVQENVPVQIDHPPPVRNKPEQQSSTKVPLVTANQSKRVSLVTLRDQETARPSPSVTPKQQPGVDETSAKKKRIVLQPANKLKVPACFLTEQQPSSSYITISDSDSEDEKEAEEEDEEEDPDVDENAEEYKQKIAQIEKLGRKLVKLSRRIKAVMEADIDCDEMDKWGNLYLQEAKLKKKHRATLQKLEDLQGELNCHYHFHVRVNCGIPPLNKYIADRLNARQKFPDIQDIRRLIDRGLKECKIQMKEKKVKSLAKQVLLDVGSQIQTHRKTELRMDGGFHLMDQVDITRDPAKEDAELRKKLKKNKTQYQRKMRDLQSAFDAKQLERELLDNDIFDAEESEGEEKKQGEENVVGEKDSHVGEDKGKGKEKGKEKDKKETGAGYWSDMDSDDSEKDSVSDEKDDEEDEKDDEEDDDADGGDSDEDV